MSDRRGSTQRCAGALLRAPALQPVLAYPRPNGDDDVAGRVRQATASPSSDLSGRRPVPRAGLQRQAAQNASVITGLVRFAQLLCSMIGAWS